MVTCFIWKSTKSCKKRLVSEDHGGCRGEGSRYMPDYYKYAKYHHFIWSAILDFGLGIIILVWNCHKWIIWPKLSLNWRITLLYQTGNDNFTTLPISTAAIFKMAAYRIPPFISEVGPRQILSLTSNEVNKTIKPPLSTVTEVIFFTLLVETQKIYPRDPCIHLC